MWKKIWINGVIIVLACLAGGAVTAKPWQVFFKQRAQSDAHMREMRIAEANGIRLLQAEDRAESSVGREEASRAAGYIGPGEVPASPPKN
jgi:hypothetical protein